MSSKNTLSENEMVKKYQGSRIFELYKKTFGNEFDEDISSKTRSKARSRYFKQMVKKEAPNWKIEEEGEGDTFVLVLEGNNEEKNSIT